MNAGTHKLGPESGKVTIHTGRAGMGAKLGHDLILEVGTWSATVTVGDDGSASSVTGSFDTTSLEVVDGKGGAKPLSDKDRGDIKKNAAEKVLQSSKHPTIDFRSTAIENGGSQVTLVGELTLVGQTRTVRVPLTTSSDGGVTKVSGRVPIVQTEWGIKPYSALMGALKVADQLEVAFDLSLPVG